MACAWPSERCPFVRTAPASRGQLVVVLYPLAIAWDLLAWPLELLTCPLWIDAVIFI